MCYSFVLFSQFDSFSFFLERLGVGVVADAFNAVFWAFADSIGFFHQIENFGWRCEVVSVVGAE